MNFLYTRKFKGLYKNLPSGIKRKFIKQISLLAVNFNHPSLQTKKIQGYLHVWEARVDYCYRFTFNREKDTIILRTIGPHEDVLRKP